MTPVVYHNSRCSKSRETVRLLKSHNVSFDTRLYLQDVPDANKIKAILNKLGFISAKERMRTKESVYKAL